MWTQDIAHCTILFSHAGLKITAGQQSMTGQIVLIHGRSNLFDVGELVFDVLWIGFWHANIMSICNGFPSWLTHWVAAHPPLDEYTWHQTKIIKQGLSGHMQCNLKQGLKFAVSQYPWNTKIWFWIPNCEWLFPQLDTTKISNIRKMLSTSDSLLIAFEYYEFATH